MVIVVAVVVVVIVLLHCSQNAIDKLSVIKIIEMKNAINPHKNGGKTRARPAYERGTKEKVERMSQC